MSNIYSILVGKINNSGSGDYHNVKEFRTLKEAKVAFDNQVSYERKTIKDWRLTKFEHIEVLLQEENLDKEDYCEDTEILDCVKLGGKE